MAGASAAGKSKVLEGAPAEAMQQAQSRPALRTQAYQQQVTAVPKTGMQVLPRTRVSDRDEVGHYLCPQCGSSSRVRDAETGEVICTNCGFVLSDPTEQYAAPVPRRTEEGLLESQSGPPGRFSAFDKNLSTIISRAQASNRSLSADERLQLWRLRRTQLRASAGSSMARNLSRAMSQLRGLAGRLNLPEVVTERAALMYRRALNK